MIMLPTERPETAHPGGVNTPVTGSISGEAEDIKI